jgi:hypothetical protein
MESYNEHYLRQAERCGRMADAAKSEQHKVGWLLLADRWLRMIREEGSNVVQVQFDTQSSTERPPPP